jgi:hypothetical protein
MPTIETIAETKNLHENASQTVDGLQQKYTNLLLIQSKVIATIEGADEVQAVHVERANNIIFESQATRSKFSEVLTLGGSVLLGAFLQGFITEYSNNRIGYMAIYASAGFVGLILVVFAYRKR